MVSYRDVSMPTSIEASLTKLPIMNAAPDSNTSVRMSSPMMRTSAHRRARRPPLLPRDPSYKTSLTSVFEICSAGAKPKRTAVARHTPAMNTNTIGSMVNSM